MQDIRYLFIRKRHPGLPSHLISCLFCDSCNRIRFGTNEDIVPMDNRTKLNRVVLQDTMCHSFLWVTKLSYIAILIKMPAALQWSGSYITLQDQLYL